MRSKTSPWRHIGKQFLILLCPLKHTSHVADVFVRVVCVCASFTPCHVCVSSPVRVVIQSAVSLFIYSGSKINVLNMWIVMVLWRERGAWPGAPCRRLDHTCSLSANLDSAFKRPDVTMSPHQIIRACARVSRSPVFYSSACWQVVVISVLYFFFHLRPV